MSVSLRLTLAGFAALALAMGIGRFAYTPLLPLMLEDGLLSLADGGLIASVHFLGYLMGALIAAKLPVSPQNMMRFSLFGIGVTTLGMGLIENVIIWSALRWIAGACSAWILVLVSNFVIRTLADAGHPGRSGAVFSGVGGGILLIGLVCLLFMTAGSGSAAGWVWVGAGSLVTAFVLCLIFGAEFPAERPARRQAGGEQRGFIWPMIISYGTAGFGYSIPATYLPVMASDIISDPLVFGWSWPLFGAAAFLSTFIAGWLRRRFSSLQIWTASQFIMGTGVLIPVVWPTITGIALSGLMVGGTFMIITMAGMQEAHRVAPAGDVMRHIAALVSAFATGQMLGPVLASSIHTVTGNFDAVLLLTTASLIATTLTLMTARSLR